MKIFDSTSDLAAVYKHIVDSLNFIKQYAEVLHFEIKALCNQSKENIVIVLEPKINCLVYNSSFIFKVWLLSF